jgi:hypothetical protein
MSDARKFGADLVTAADLEDYGLTPHDVRRRCPWAVEHTALDGSPCWLRSDLTVLLGADGEDQP